MGSLLSFNIEDENSPKLETPERTQIFIDNFEPLRANRFILDIPGSDIPQFQFRSYKLRLVKNLWQIKVDILETEQYQTTTQRIRNLIGLNLILTHLNSTGGITSTSTYRINNLVSISQDGGYEFEDLLATTVILIISEIN